MRTKYGGRAAESESSSDDLDIVAATRRTLEKAREVILVPDSVSTAEDDSEEGVDIDRPQSRVNSNKHKAGERVEWSADEDDDAYEKFKGRAAAKRKRVSLTKKKLKENAKVNTKKKGRDFGRRSDRTVEDGESESDDKVLDQGEGPADGEYDMFEEEEVPKYVVERRKTFDRRRSKLEQGALMLPPTWSDVEFSDDEILARLEERPKLPSSIRTSRKYQDITMPRSLGVIPAPIAQYLRDYQIRGVEFLHELFVYQKGGILGDDMGLGKTVQVAAFLVAAFGKTGDERDDKRMRKMRRTGGHWYPRALIICPGTLIENWKQELQRWGWWHVDAFHGESKEGVLNAATSGRLEIVITTYTTYRMNASEINLIEWDCVIADECHIMKERSSEITKAMNQVNALCRIGLSGTAIQNKYEEMWTLLNWTNPGRFGPIAQWKGTISDPLRKGQSHDATNHELAIARKTATKLVTNLLPQFFIRRTKSLIAHELPKKSDRVVFCPLTNEQKQAYEQFLQSEIVEIVKNASEACDCGSGNKRGWCCYIFLPGSTTPWKALVFPVIISLQKLANHLALLIPNSKDPREKQQRDLEFLQEFVPHKWKELYSNRDSLFNLANPEFCGKWAVLKKLLRHWHGNGDKVLVFSHSVRMLKMLEHLFKNTSYNVSYLDGSLALPDRQAVVDAFNSDPGQFVFLISTKAGGVGLNITSANKVVIMDPNWNPSYDLQAQDRAYRIGQTRDVEVFRLVSAGTIEEITYARQIYKQQQANIGYNASLERRYFKGVQNDKTQKGELFGLENLLTFHGDNIVLRDIVNKTNIAEARAGVSLCEIDLDDAGGEDDEDNPLNVEDADETAALSQLAALITGDDDGKTKKRKKDKKTRPKTDPISAILASAGVEYTHENSEVVGSSKVEAQLSRRAAETGSDLTMGREVLFAEEGTASHYPNHLDGPGLFQYKYRPAEDIRKRQFCTMAKTLGFESAIEFALVVEGMTQVERRNCLDRFYRKRKERFMGIEELEAEKAMGDDDDDNGEAIKDDAAVEITLLERRGLDGGDDDTTDDEL